MLKILFTLKTIQNNYLNKLLIHKYTSLTKA